MSTEEKFVEWFKKNSYECEHYTGKKRAEVEFGKDFIESLLEQGVLDHYGENNYRLASKTLEMRCKRDILKAELKEMEEKLKVSDTKWQRYMQIIYDLHANFGYDGDCDDGQIVDATPYHSIYEETLENDFGLQEDDEDYGFVWDLMESVTRDGCYSDNDPLKDKFLKEYKTYKNMRVNLERARKTWATKYPYGE
jgi:hypothetical protein